MKNIPLSWKLFLLSLLWFLLPFIAWYAGQLYEKNLEQSAVRKNQESLNLYHGFLEKLLLEDSEFSQQLSLEAISNEVLIAKRKGPILIDGFSDEWFPYKNNVILSRNDKEPSSAVFIEDERFIYGLISVNDNQIIYKESPYSSNSSDMIRIDLGLGYWLFQTVAPGRIAVLREYGNGFKPLNSVMAIWQETASGYNLEFRVPKALVGNKVNIALYDVDNPTHESYEEKYQGVFTFTDFSYFPLSREKNSDWLLEHKLTEERLTIINKSGQVIYQVGNLFPSEETSLLVNDRYRGAKKIDDAFSRKINSDGVSFEQVSQNKKNFLVRSGDSLKLNQKLVGMAILETSIYKNKVNFQRLAFFTAAVFIFIWLILLVSILKQVSQYRSRLKILNELTEEAYENDAEAVNLTNLDIAGNDEVSQLYTNLAYYNERLEQRRDHQQKLLARLNHELRTPLAIIGSSLDNLEVKDFSEDDKQLVSNARAGLERLSLSFSRLSEANRLEDSIDKVSLDWFDLIDFMPILQNSYTNAWPSVDFIFNLPKQKVKIHGAKELFAQMMDKIVSNAVDFSSEQKPIVIDMALSKRELILTITNIGPIIPTEKLKSVFNLMESQRTGKASQNTNLGLGLYIAKLIAKRHKAKIRAKNLELSDGVQIELIWNKKNFVIL